MFWIRSGLHSISISDWLTAGAAVAADPSVALDEARAAMLDALGDAGRRKRPSLSLRIAAAADPQSLWALRTDLMTVACQCYGEVQARRRVAGATAAFEGLLPVARLTGARGGRGIAA